MALAVLVTSMLSVVVYLLLLSSFDFSAVRVLAQTEQQQLPSRSCVEITVNEQFSTFDIVLAQNVEDEKNKGVSVAYLVDRLFRITSHAEHGQELAENVSIAVVVATRAPTNGAWQYKLKDDVWTGFPENMSVSNAWLIRRNGFIRFVPNSDYFNVPAVGVPYPELTFHGWSGFGLNNISDVAIENCEFSRSPGKIYAKVLELNFVRAVEVTPFSMKLEVSVQLTDNVIDGDIQYDLELSGVCVVRSVTEKVSKVLASAVGGVLSQEIHFLQPATPYEPRVKIFSPVSNNVNNNIDVCTDTCIPVTTVPDAVRNVQVKKVADSLDINIFWEAAFTLQGGLIEYRVVIDGKEGKLNSGSKFPFCPSLGSHEDGFVVKSPQTTVRGLRSNSLYEVRIAAFGAAVNLDPCPPPLSPFSMPVLFETNVGQVPSPPYSMKVYEAGPYAVAVQWEFPGEPGGAITDFIVELNKVTMSNQQSASPYREFVADAIERSYVFTSVLEGDFYVTVRAKNSRGLGLPAKSPIVTITPPRRGMPNITVTGVSEFSATISWIIDKPFTDEPQSNFNVLLYPNDDCRKGNPNDGTNISSGIYNASSLHPFTAYSVCVWNFDFPLNTSSIAFFVTNQSTPTGRTTVHDVSNLMSHASRTDSVLLQWTPVDKPNGVIGYEVIVQQLKGLSLNTTSFSLLLDPNLLPPPRQDSLYYQWRVTGLEAGVGYNFTVRPYNLLYNTPGNGTSIDIFTFVGRIGPPTISPYTNVTDTSVTIRWDPPVERNVDILLYALALDAPDVNTSNECLMDEQVVSVFPQEGGLLEYTFTNLRPTTSYVATIQAKTIAGYGEMSLPFAVMTTPHGPCLSTNCSNSAICVPQGSNSFQCFCVSGFVGDGHICVEQSFPVIEALSSQIHITGLEFKYGDFLMLNNTPVTIQLLTPNGQLVKHKQSSFQLHHVKGVTLYPVVFEKLQPGVKYILNYSFLIGSFVQNGSETTTTQSSVPQAPPTVVSITDITNISAAVLWQPPPRAFRNGPLTGYDVVVNSLFTINGSFVTMRNTTKNIASLIIDDLLPFQKYEVSVAARTSEGGGPWSNARSFTTKSATPGPPRIDDAFDVFNGSNSYVHVTWRYPALPGGEITHFLISAGSGETLLDFSTVDAAENALSLENPESLNVSLQHRSRVQARSNSSHGISILAIKDVQSSEEQKDGIEFSEPVARDGQLCDGPSYPESANVTNITQSESGNFSATVTWSEANISSILNIPANVTYHMFPMRGKEECKRIRFNVPFIFSASSTSGVLSDLLPNSIYSVCIGVASTHGDCIVHVFARTFVVTPQSVPGPVTSLSVRSLSSESAELTWLPPMSPNGVVGYEVAVEESNGSNASFIRIQPSDLVTSDRNRTVGVLLSSLNGGKVYNMSVRAYNLKSGDNGPLVSTNLTMELGTPRPPRDVTAMSDGPNSIELHWSSSVSNGVTGYQITRVLANTIDNHLPDYFISHRSESVGATKLEYTIHDLEPNTMYALWVKTMGLGPTSQPSEVVFRKTKKIALSSRCDDLNCILSEVRDIALNEFTIQLAEEIANATAWQLKNNAVTPDELQRAIYVVKYLVDMQEQALVAGIRLIPSDSYVDTFTQLSSIMLDLQHQKSWLALNSSEGGPLFLNSLERYGRVTVASYSFSDGSFSKTFTSDNSVLVISSVTELRLRSVSFSSDSLTSQPSSPSKGNMAISSSLLSQLLQQSNATRILVSSTIFQNLHQYMPSNTSDETLPVGAQRNSSREVATTVLMSASIVEEMDGQPYDSNYMTQRLPENVTIAYSNIEPNGNAHYTCSFWQFGTNSTPGQWSSSGVTTKQLDDTNISCISTHLTSFSVLVSVESAVSSDALTYITYIGCGISLLCLFITLVVLIAFRSYLSPEKNFININFVVALMLALIVFIVGIDWSSNRDVCKAITVALHYLFLAVFCWMLCEGYLLYLLLIVVFDTGRTYYKRYFAFGWGFPILIVGVSFGLKRDEYGAHDYCFLTHHDYLIYAFVGPMAAILLFNLVMFIKAVKVVMSRSASTTINKKIHKDRLQVARSGLKAMGVFLPILGLTWGIGVFAVDTLSLPLAYAFTILNSLQGLFVFIFHCLLNKQIHKAIKTIRQKREQMKSLQKSMGTCGTGINAIEPKSGDNRRTYYVDIEASMDDSMIQTPQVELHHFEQRDIDNLESVDTQLKVETSIRNSNSMMSVRSDEPLRKYSDSSAGRDSKDDHGRQEEHLYKNYPGRSNEATTSDHKSLPLSPDAHRSVSAADCLVIPNDSSHEIILRQGREVRISVADNQPPTVNRSLDHHPSLGGHGTLKFNLADASRETYV